MSQKPKLLLVADTYYPKVDGTLRFMEEFIKRSSTTFDISLLVPQLDEKKQRHRPVAITFLKPSVFFSLSGYPSMRLSYRNVKNIKAAIKNADLVFIQGPAIISYLSVYYAHKYHKKTVFYLHTITWELFEKFLPPLLNKIFFRIIKRFSIIMYNLCDEIFIPYQDLKTQLAAAGVKTTMTVARLGVDIELFSPAKDKKRSKKNLGMPENKKVIGYVGRISKEKNTEILRDAFLKLPHQEELQLLMVGDGPASITEKFKSIPNCTVTGFVPDVQKYLQAMDIFVMPSLTETTSLATLEAMSCSLPVIASKVGFIKNYLVKDHNGLFFPQNSAAILALKIEKLLHDETARQVLGKNARRMVAYSFSWERSINRIKRFLLQVYFQKKENE